jgi:hypothetical protein
MKNNIVLSLMFVLCLAVTAYAAQRMVVCEELYSEN